MRHKGSVADILYMDFSGAPQKVPHDRLILNIKMHGIIWSY